MANTMLPCSDECMAGLCNLVPGFAGMSDGDKMAHLHGHLMSLKNGMARMSADKDTLASQLQAMSSAGGKGPQLLSADLIPDVRDGASTYADLAVEKGAITPGVLDGLYQYLVGTVEKPNQFCMSLNPQTNNRPAVEVFKLLLSNVPKPADGVRTGVQTFGGGGQFKKPPCADGLLTKTGAESPIKMQL